MVDYMENNYNIVKKNFKNRSNVEIDGINLFQTCFEEA